MLITIIVNPLQKDLSILVTQSPCFKSGFSISSPGFQKSSQSFLKDESGFFGVRIWVSKYAVLKCVIVTN